MELHILRCPTCNGPVEVRSGIVRCGSCRQRFDTIAGVLDLRTANGSAAARAPVEEVSIAESLTLQAALRTVAVGPCTSAMRGGHVLEGTEYAWSVFLDMRPGRRVLDLGCGFGARSARPARQGACVIAVETRESAAAFTWRRLTSHTQPGVEAEVAVLLVSDYQRLPLRDRSIDVVLLPVDLQCASHEIVKAPGSRLADARTQPARDIRLARVQARALLSEVRRVLAPNGQVGLVAANAWSFDRLYTKARVGMSRAWAGIRRTPTCDSAGRNQIEASAKRPLYGLDGYRGLLHGAGLSVTTCLAQSRSRAGDLTALRSLDGPRLGLKLTDLRARLRASPRCVPEFALVARHGSGPGVNLLGRVLDAVGTVMNATENTRARRLHVSRKDKLVIDAVIGTSPVIVRIALSEGAEEAESRSARTLQHLYQHRPEGVWYPRLLASGVVDGLNYAAEERLTGIPMGRAPAMEDADRAFEVVSDLLDCINPGLAGSAFASLDDEYYAHSVRSHLDRVLSVVGEEAPRQRLLQVCESNLRGLDIRPGIRHGDLSMSNIFMHGERASAALIDWEDASIQGLPILDVHSFLLSWAIARGKAVTLSEAFHRLHIRSLTTEEQAFMSREYARTGTCDEAHVALVHLTWIQLVSRLLAFSFMQTPGPLRFYVYDVLGTLLNDRQSWQGK